jgi:hypothetical protein
LKVLDRCRHVLIILVIAAAVVFLEPVILSGSTPLVSGLAQADRMSLYNQVIVVTASLLGFMVAAVAILVSLDRTRTIVKKLQRGESFHLLIVNMLGAIGMLFVLTVLGIIGAVAENDGGASHWFERIYEWILLAAVMEVGLALWYFSIVMYVLAEHEETA